jgi:hypothetical protein
MIQALRGLTFLLIFLLPFTAEAQRDYWKNSQGGDAATASLDNPQSSNFVPISDRINEVECAALRNVPRPNTGNFVADIIRGDQALQPSSSVICPCAPKPGLWLERLVFCFADAPDGLLYNITQSLIALLKPYYLAIYAPLIMFATAIFGWKMATGGLRSLPKETFLFAVKLGAIVFFLAEFPAIHALVLRMVQGLAEIPSNALAGFSDICNFGPGVRKPNLWAQFDCLFGKLTGVTVANPNPGSPVSAGLFMGMFGYILSYVFLPGWGAAIVMAGVSFIFALFGAALRAVNTYFMAIIAVSFLLLLAPIFVPMILFGATAARYESYLKTMIGYMLQPMILFLFMGIMMVALQFALFQGPGSLCGIISNTNCFKPQFFTTQFVENSGGNDITRNFKKIGVLQSSIAMNPEKTLSKPGQANSMQYGDKKSNVGVATNLPLAPSGATSGSDSMQGDVKVNAVDAEGLVKDVNAKKGAVKWYQKAADYIEAVILQLLTTLILTFTLYTMLGHLPSVVHGLVGSGASNLMSAKIPGEDQAGRLIATAKGALKAKSSKSGSARDIIRQSFNNMTGGR